MRFHRIAVSLLAFVAFLLGSTSSWAQGEKPNMFATMAECKAAKEAGNFRYYEPKFFGLHDKEPANGRDRIVIPLEGDECIHMVVVGGWRYIVQKEGTKFRFRRLEDGSLKMYARDDCGNDADEFGYPPPVPAPAPTPTAPPEPKRVVVEVPPHTFTQAVANVTINLPTPPPQESRQVEISKGKGFCSSKKCKVLIGALVVGGYSALAYENCWFPYGYGRIKR